MWTHPLRTTGGFHPHGDPKSTDFDFRRLLDLEPFGVYMRRVGVVGDGLTGLIASLSIGSNGGEAALFGRTEPMGGLASPVDPDATWLFDRVPIFWREKAIFIVC